MTNDRTRSGDDDSLLDELFSSDRDRGDDTASPGDDDQPSAQAQQEAEPEADVQPVEEPSSEQPHRHQVPLKELKAEREKRQSAESALEEIRRENAARDAEYRRQLDDLARRITQPPQHQYAQEPDPELEPEAYAENRILGLSEVYARRNYGSDVVDKAFQAAQGQGLIDQRVFLAKPDPWGAMVEWHKQHLAQQEIGGDIEAYKKRLEDEVRQKVLAELKSGGGKAAQKFPSTLADQTATGPSGVLPQSDEAMGDEIFSSERKSRFK